MQREHRREFMAAVLLCVTAGYADAVGYIHAGVFAANMTGNTVLSAISLIHHDWAAAIERLLTLVAFFAGAVAGRLCLHGFKFNPAPALFLESVLLGAAIFIDPKSAWSIFVIAAAMGVQATAMTKFLGSAVSTVVITSTMARIAETTTDALIKPFSPAKAAVQMPVRLLISTWVCYGIGAALAILLLSYLALPLIIPAALMLALAVWFAPWKGFRWLARTA